MSECSTDLQRFVKAVGANEVADFERVTGDGRGIIFADWVPDEGKIVIKELPHSFSREGFSIIDSDELMRETFVSITATMMCRAAFRSGATVYIDQTSSILVVADGASVYQMTVESKPRKVRRDIDEVRDELRERLSAIRAN